MSQSNPADKHIELILECWVSGGPKGMDTARMVQHLSEWHGIHLTEADVANALAKFRDNLALQTEARIAAGF